MAEYMPMAPSASNASRKCLCKSCLKNSRRPDLQSSNEPEKNLIASALAAEDKEEYQQKLRQEKLFEISIRSELQ